MPVVRLLPLLLLALLLPAVPSVATGAAAADVPTAIAAGEVLEVGYRPQALGLPAGDDPATEVDAELTGPVGEPAGVQPLFWLIPQVAYREEAWSTERHARVPWERFRASGAGCWCLRLAPERPGRWCWRLRIRQAGHPPRVVEPAAAQVTVRATRAPGAHAVHVAPDGTFREVDGSAFIPVGVNCAWPDEAGAAGYGAWLDQLAAAGGTATRLWLVHYYGGTAPEWTPSPMNAGYQGVGHYSQEAGARVDAILAHAQARGVHVMLCLWTFGDTGFDWAGNPYAQANGGPLRDPGDLFTDPRALASQERLLRYVVARWSAYGSLWCWELWNEADNCAHFDDAVVARWHQRMAGLLTALDAHRHPVTTSYRWPPPVCACGALRLPGIAFAQLHCYTPDLLGALPAQAGALATLGLPWLAGEVGIAETPESLAGDPRGLHLHDALWLGLFAGGMGSGLPWWWDRYIAARGLWRHCQGLARFVAGEDPAGMAAVAARTDQDGVRAWARAAPQRCWAWVAADRQVTVAGTVEAPVLRYARSAVPPARELTLALPRGTPAQGWWRIVFRDPYDGTWMAERVVAAPAAARPLVIPLPPYRDQVALSARWSAVALAPTVGPPPPTPWHDLLDGG